VERVGIGAETDGPGLGAHGEDEAGRDADHEAASQPRHEGGHDAHRRGREQGVQQVGAERLVAQRLEQDGCDPGQQRVRRVARGMGNPQHRPDRLELGRIPEADVGHERAPIKRQRHEGDDDRCDELSMSSGARQRCAEPRALIGAVGYQPETTPQYTPHALMMIECTISAAASTNPTMPSRLCA
jgi:hypothetical protein